ncbi:MAG: ABC-F family ATP-binding cassette domain-containing protein [Bacteroidales bacterium]
MVSLQNLSVEFTSRSIFEQISYVINKKDRIALVGKNGAGKTTMLKVIAGLQSPTSGSVSVPSDITIGYLPQHMTIVDNNTLIDDVTAVFDHIKQMQADLDAMNVELLTREDYESEDYHKLIDRMTHLTDMVNMAQSENATAEIEKTLMGLGFSRNDFNRPTSEFSGGWRMRIELAKLLLRKPELLLLDEPTNHLDIESIQWLENFLKTKADAVLLVSHDRAFIDNVTNRTIEISLGKIYDYQVNYSKFVELRKERVEQQQRAFQNQQKQIQDTEEFIERFRYKSTKSVQVQSRIKQLAKIDRIEVDEVDNSRLSLKFPPAPRSGDFPLITDGLAKYYGEHKVFADATLTVRRGDKIAFVGKNGEGKTTLVKCIMNQIAYDGELKIGHNVKIGYFAQNQASLLDGELTVFDTIDHVAVGDIRTKIRDILGAFMFGGEDIDKKVKVLSGGEKTRLAMIKLLLEPVNLLILDEPTNHLDMRTKDVLKQAINDFGGTVIVVSHDREFLDGLVTKVYEFGGGRVKEHLGGIYDFLQNKQIDSLRVLEQEQKSKAAAQQQQTLSKSPTHNIAQKVEPEKRAEGKVTYAALREQGKLIKRAEKKVAEAEVEIARIEDVIATLEVQMNEGYSAENADIFTEHAAMQKKLDNAMSLWEIATMELEEFKSKK